MKSALLINYSANNNYARKKWRRIKEKVLKQIPKNTILIPYEVPFNMNQCLKKLINDEGINYIISAGGDGSVNYILNNLIRITGRNSRNYCLGAIGLGTSNDFLKPFSSYIGGIPVKINADFTNLTDVGRVIYLDEKSEIQSRYFIVNANLGITADANVLFNNGDFFIRHLKTRFPGLAIVYTAIKTIINYKNKEIILKDEGRKQLIKVANVSITKNPYISGSFHYDQGPGMTSGNLGFHCTGDMTKMEIIKTLYDLSRGKYTGIPKRSTSFVNKVDLSSMGILALETDGEVQMGKSFSFTTVPKSLCLAL